MRTHRVGSITAGIALIIYGLLFLIHIFLPQISYEILFKLWPMILIGMGIEIIVSNQKHTGYVYDKGAVVLLVMMMFFAVCMAGADFVMANLSLL